MLVVVTAAAVGNSGASTIVTGPTELCIEAICWIIPAPEAVADAIYPPVPVKAKPEETLLEEVPSVPDGTSEASKVLFPTT